MLETWVWTDRLQNILKIRWKSIKWDIKQSVEGWKCLTRTHLHYDFVEDFIHKNQSLLSMPNSSHKSQIICQKSIYENIIFQEYIESVWTSGERGERTYGKHVPGATFHYEFCCYFLQNAQTLQALESSIFNGIGCRLLRSSDVDLVTTLCKKFGPEGV